MIKTLIEEKTRHDIDNLVERLLKDIQAFEPPLKLPDVLDHLKLHKSYFTLDDPGLIAKVRHKIKVGTATGLNMVEKIFKKISLQAMTFPAEKKILIYKKIPSPKMRWAEAHEICHNLIPTHQYFLVGDVSETLDEDYRVMIEAEANYGASALIFMGNLFSQTTLDLSTEWKTIDYLKKRFKNSYTSTLRRYIHFSDESPKVGFVHTPLWKEKPDDQITRCRYFVKNKKFEIKFSNVVESELMETVDNYIYRARGGPVGQSSFCLKDDNGETHEFVGYSFFNQHYVLTLIAYLAPQKTFILCE